MDRLGSASPPPIEIDSIMKKSQTGFENAKGRSRVYSFCCGNTKHVG
jgi:hypothetical protein